MAVQYLPEAKGKGLKEIGEIFDGDELLTETQAIRKHIKEQHEAEGCLRERKVTLVSVHDLEIAKAQDPDRE